MTSRNPFRAISRIPDTDSLVSIAFRRALKIQVKRGRESYTIRARRRERDRIVFVGDYFIDHIFRIIKEFPDLDELHPFYYQLADIIIGVDALRKQLGRLQGITYSLRDIQTQILQKLDWNISVKDAVAIRNASFGRFGNMIRKTSDTLNFLIEARSKLTQVPGLDIQQPTIVLAGSPNVGKSSLIKLLSSGKPEIAAYPFTTKDVTFGHRKIGFLTTQMVDTPGLLDRPLENRNAIELQSITALKEIADIVLIILDVSPQRSLDIESQLNLVQDIKSVLPDTVVLYLINKIDMVDEVAADRIQELYPSAISISVLQEKGIDELLNRLESIILQDLLKKDKFRKLTTPLIDEA